MDSFRCDHGTLVQYDRPIWEPLLEFAPDHVDDFMWMHEVELEGGIRLQAYKHRETRQYLHLDADGYTFIYCDGGRYREVDPERLLAVVLRRR